MHAQTNQQPNSPFLDKTEIRRIVAEQNAALGFVPDPTDTAEKAQVMVAELLHVRSLLPEDNIFAGGIIAAREGE